MGKVRKIKNSELVGGTNSEDVYPITSVKAVYDAENIPITKYINNLKKTHTFGGIISPSSSMSVPDGLVFYLAVTSGVYVNYDNIEVGDTIVIIINDSNNKWTGIVTSIPTFEANSVDGNAIKGSTITTSKIANAAITTEKINDKAITNSKIASNAVNTENITDFSVSLSKLANTVSSLIWSTVNYEDIDALATSYKLTSPTLYKVVADNKVAGYLLMTLDSAVNQFTQYFLTSLDLPSSGYDYHKQGLYVRTYSRGGIYESAQGTWSEWHTMIGAYNDKVMFSSDGRSELYNFPTGKIIELNALDVYNIKKILNEGKIGDTYIQDDITSAEFNISDEDGNILVQFKGGHIKTQNFDSSTLNNKVKGYSYIGNRIDLSEYQYSRELLFIENTSSASSKQGAACFGKYLFQCHNTHDIVSIFNMETGNKVQEIALTAISTCHCNNVNFGNEYYNSADPFPLFYVSQEDETKHNCLVYRITGSEGSWTMSLVQTITLPTPSNEFMWYPNCMIDTMNSKLIVAGLRNKPWTHNVDNIPRYKTFRLPKLSEGDVTLSLSEIEDSIEIKYYPTTQGGFVHNNKLYQVFGGPDNGQLIVLDLVTHKVVSTINISNDIKDEPEGCFRYDNTLCINFVTGEVYKFKF